MSGLSQKLLALRSNLSHSGKGFFLTLEGIEGVGKSTCLKLIAKYLKKKKVSYIVTREPGGTPFAEKIRALLLRSYIEKIHDDTELLLLFAARAQHIAQVILPALKQGVWVISDRFTEASYAYQGGGRGIPEKRIAILEKWVQNKFKSDLTLLLDAPVKKALSRTHSRTERDRIEKEKEVFFCKVRQAYLDRAKKFSHRYCRINAAKPLSQVAQNLHEIIDNLILINNK